VTGNHWKMKFALRKQKIRVADPNISF